MIPPPSPSYTIAEKLQNKGPIGAARTPMPACVKEELQDMRALIIARDKEEREARAKQAEMSKKPRAGPEQLSERNPFAFVSTEGGSGYHRPKAGDIVQLGYAVAMEDGSIIDLCPDLTIRLPDKEGEHPMDSKDRGFGRVTAESLSKAAMQMKRGQVASMRCTLGDLFPTGAPAIKTHGADAEAVFEVRLCETFRSQDVSFKKGTGEVIKEVTREGVGEWCDNPTDAGYAELQITEVRNSAGVCLFPKKGGSAITVQVTPGDGEVCDALECAMLHMKRHEKATITVRSALLLAGGAPFPKSEDVPQVDGAIHIRACLLDYCKGPEAWKLEEAQRLEHAAKRKVVANRLFREGRYRLARERYLQAIDLFSHMDLPKARDRFLGQPQVLADCKAFRVACRLNIAACSIKLEDPPCARAACDAVLYEQPQNSKALYRRAQAHMLTEDYGDACRDLRRLLDVESTCKEARELLREADKMRKHSDRQQLRPPRCPAAPDASPPAGDGSAVLVADDVVDHGACSKLSFSKMISGLDDIRSEKKADYMDIDLDWDDDDNGIEGMPVSVRPGSRPGASA